MIRAYTKVLSLRRLNFSEFLSSDLLNKKVAEAIESIQECGGSVINSSLYPISITIAFQFYVLYEDNGKYEAIDNQLRNEIFNFTDLK